MEVIGGDHIGLPFLLSTRLVDDPRGGTEAIVLVGVSGHSVSIGFNRFFPTPTQSMTTATATINGNTIEGEAAFIAEVLLKMSEPVKEAAGKVEISEEDAEQLTFKELTFELIKPEFGDQLAQQIVDKLEYCRNHYNGFNQFKGMYRKMGTIQQRQLLKTVSAVYRFKFGKFHCSTSKYCLKSQIKWDTMCPHCGTIAKTFVQRLTKEGIWTL